MQSLVCCGRRAGPTLRQRYDTWAGSPERRCNCWDCSHHDNRKTLLNIPLDLAHVVSLMAEEDNLGSVAILGVIQDSIQGVYLLLGQWTDIRDLCYFPPLAAMNRKSLMLTSALCQP